MLGTIEELEKDIELFQKNVAASGEMVQLLNQMLLLIKQQNDEFSTKSVELISSVDNLPQTIKNANNDSNDQLRKSIINELEKAIGEFTVKQKVYLDKLEDTRKQLEECVRRTDAGEIEFKKVVLDLLDQFKGIPTKIEQNEEKQLQELKNAIDKLTSERNAEFIREQSKYIEALTKTEERVDNCEKQLESKYKEFVDTLDKMNVSSIYNQNMELKSELNKRTTILMIISSISVILAIVGFFV